MSDQEETKADPKTFDFDAYPEGTLFYERRTELERRGSIEPSVPILPPPPVAKSAGERRAKKERRRRIDPTTFEKQYTDDEMEFMNAMQRFKVRTGKSFPTHREVLDVVFTLGYRKLVIDDDCESSPLLDEDYETEAVDATYLN